MIEFLGITKAKRKDTTVVCLSSLTQEGALSR